jgi:hypothetical protein
MIAWTIFFGDSDLIVNKLRLLHGKGVSSGTRGILFNFCIALRPWFILCCISPSQFGVTLNIDSNYRVIINYCPIGVGVGHVVECAASLMT